MTGTTLVGYDGSDNARAALAYAAQRVGTGGRIVVAHVIAPPAMFIDTPYYDDSVTRAREHGERSMRELEDILGGVPAEQRLAEGPPAATLVSLARETAADEILVGSRGFGGGRAMFGSVSHALLHDADRPVVVVPRPTPV